MAGELNTEVLDDPMSCKEMAAWLGRLESAVKQIGDAVFRQRSESEYFWEGTAGDACRNELTRQGKDGDTLEQSLATTREALTTFASKIDAVRSQIEEARNRARAGELIITATAILPPGPTPGPAPQPLPYGPVAPDVRARHDAATQAHGAAVAQYERKQQAFEDASRMVEKARDEQADAHAALDRALKGPQDTVKKVKTYVMFAVGNGLSWVKTVQTTANDLMETAAKKESAATTMQARAASTASPAMREIMEKAAAKGWDQAGELRAQYWPVQRLNSAVPQGARTIIESNSGNLIKGGSAVAKVGKSALRGLPYVGTGLTVASGVADVAMGKDPWNAGADTAASLGGSIAGGMAVGAALGTVFPGPGNAIGGVIGGIAGGILATGVVDMLQGDA